MVAALVVGAVTFPRFLPTPFGLIAVIAAVLVAWDCVVPFWNRTVYPSYGPPRLPEFLGFGRRVGGRQRSKPAISASREIDSPPTDVPPNSPSLVQALAVDGEILRFKNFVQLCHRSNYVGRRGELR